MAHLCLLSFFLVATQCWAKPGPKLLPRFSVVCAPDAIPEAGRIGLCVSSGDIENGCMGEFSTSPHCMDYEDSWCCYIPPFSSSSEFLPTGRTLKQMDSNNTCQNTTATLAGPDYINGAPILAIPSGQTVMVCPNTFEHDRILLSGVVRFNRPGAACGVPQRVLLDIWQTNETASYSHVPAWNQGLFPLFAPVGPFTLQTNATPYDLAWECRMKLITGDDGVYSISTVMPGRYPFQTGWRPAHIHFRVTPLDSNNNPIGDTFTTQVYFAPDIFLGDNDACPVCMAGDPTITLNLQRPTDYKTSVGVFDFLI